MLCKRCSEPTRLLVATRSNAAEIHNVNYSSQYKHPKFTLMNVYADHPCRLSPPTSAYCRCLVITNRALLCMHRSTTHVHMSIASLMERPCEDKRMTSRLLARKQALSGHRLYNNAIFHSCTMQQQPQSTAAHSICSSSSSTRNQTQLAMQVCHCCC